MTRTADGFERGAIVDTLFARARASAELTLAIGRIVLVTAFGVRFFAVGSLQEAGGPLRTLLAMTSSALAIGMSIWLIFRARSLRVTPALAYLSISLDALLSFMALLSNVLWPWESYQGILRVPDVAGLLIATLAAALRISTVGGLLGSLLNLAAGAALVAVDLHLNALRVTYAAKDVSMLLVLIAASGAISTISVARAKRLAEASGRELVRAEVARHSLSLVVSDHHDVRSLLSAASIHADLLVRKLEQSEGRAPAAAQTARELRADLDELAALMNATRDRAHAELAAQESTEGVSVCPVAERVVTVLRRRFVDTAIEIRAPARDLRVGIVGGMRGLERVLLNLLVNACEGDGRTRASAVCLDIEPTPTTGIVKIRVLDDGPGLLDGTAGEGPGRVTSKADGSGLGLYLTARIVDASGGKLELANAARGGCEATVVLPAA